ncbi:MAG TPA: hypothetical protein VK537_02650, partial [Galbitalea sp.]|nr:hypothetical protein [Galbitalea sp.]
MGAGAAEYSARRASASFVWAGSVACPGSVGSAEPGEVSAAPKKGDWAAVGAESPGGGNGPFDGAKDGALGANGSDGVCAGSLPSGSFCSGSSGTCSLCTCSLCAASLRTDSWGAVVAAGSLNSGVAQSGGPCGTVGGDDTSAVGTGGG